MNVNKKFDRLLHRAKEGMMGAEAKTEATPEFKELQQEMQRRNEGMDKLHRTMGTYVKSLSKRSEDDTKEKTLPVGALGSSMIAHGSASDGDPTFGSCLTALGNANQRIAREQETYVANATATWLESLEHSLAQMKEYQNARKKLEQRRLAYDTALTKMQKAKKEDYRVEEELRTQKVKYEDASDDVLHRMQDIQEAERNSVNDLTSFLDAQLEHYERCTQILMQIKSEWPVESSERRRSNRSRSNTARSYDNRYNAVEEEEVVAPRLTIPKYSSRGGSATSSPVRPPISRSTTFEGPTRILRDLSPVPMPHLRRVPTEPGTSSAARRPYLETNMASRPYDDQGTSSPFRNRSSSPAPSYGSGRSVSESSTPIEKKRPPPPPPSRAKKPAPPPPPVRRPI